MKRLVEPLRKHVYVDPLRGDDRNECSCPVQCDGLRISCRLKTFAELLRRHRTTEPPIVAMVLSDLPDSDPVEGPLPGGMEIMGFRFNEELKNRMSQDAVGKVVASLEYEQEEDHWVMTFEDGSEMSFRFMAELVNR